MDVARAWNLPERNIMWTKQIMYHNVAPQKHNLCFFPMVIWYIHSFCPCICVFVYLSLTLFLPISPLSLSLPLALSLSHSLFHSFFLYLPPLLVFPSVCFVLSLIFNILLFSSRSIHLFTFFFLLCFCFLWFSKEVHQIKLPEAATIPTNN